MSDDEWDAEDFKPKFLAKSDDKWEGEDEDDDAPDDWEAEDDEEKVAANATDDQEVPKKKKQTLAERIAEKELKRREELERRKQEEENAAAEMTPEQRLAEKQRAIKMQEDADLEVAMETFGISKADLPTATSPLDATPSDKDGFDAYRAALLEKMRPMESSPFYIGFLEELLRDLCWNMESDDVKKVSSSLNALYNDKVKSKQGKSKKKKGASVKVEKSAYDDYEDFF